LVGIQHDCGNSSPSSPGPVGYLVMTGYGTKSTPVKALDGHQERVTNLAQMTG
jgi:hypothetical protein